ncbi:hypothetical protein SCHPADRAFT_848902 [Schizopora paradoxa]|uniref:Uncharacterized protein n=1 Tax=Schizopora paradoxa TaxID=27342 RepID=A0A0H2S248_9AGAM|nr:hypothetical protein SCHPADRAFT_848902 [Schizopora paradoxa]
MVGSSELSDALNPNYSTRRPHIGTQNIQNTNGNGLLDPHILPSPTQQHQHILPSSLSVPQDAFVASPLTPETLVSGFPSGQSPVASPNTLKQRQEPIQIIRNIMSLLSEQKRAFDLERERRLAWETQQETKVAGDRAVLESRIASMQKEIDDLKSRLPSSVNADGTNEELHVDSHERQRKVSACSDLPSNMYTFPPEANHDSDNKDLSSITYVPQLQQTASSQVAEAGALPLPEFVQGSSISPSISPSEEQPRKRMRTRSPSHASAPHASTRSHSRQSQPRSIMAAMRSHFLRCMGMDHDKSLPSSFREGDTLRDDEPVRFVWEHTTKKSIHNANMKKRIVSDIIANKALYPLVSEDEFTKDILDSVFEQAFTTFRTKFTNQASARQSQTDDKKAQKARRQGRKKVKLANRVSTRELFEEYSNNFFDAAFQMECMSSEESSSDVEDEEVYSDDDRPKGILNIRCLAWRSSRLQKLYELIDEREEFERSQKPRRGVGRKDRRFGQPKDGNPLPPTGVRKWMVSKKWFRESQSRSTHVANILKDSVLDDGEAAWMSLAPLGPESDYEDNPQPPMMMPSTEFNNAYYGESQWADGLGFVNMNGVLQP